jgi:putative DNA primase/helicase
MTQEILTIDQETLYNEQRTMLDEDEESLGDYIGLSKAWKMLNLPRQVNIPLEKLGQSAEEIEDYKITDMANAKRLVKLYGDKARYVPAWNNWIIWNGKYWERDDALKIVNLAKQTVVSMYDQTSSIADAAKRTEFAKNIPKCEGSYKIKAMIELARSDAVTKHDEFDTHPMLFNCQNGTLDLTTGKLKSFDPKDMLTKFSDVRYDPNAKCPKWLQSLHKAFQGSEGLIRYYQKLAGYTMTGSTQEQCFFLLWGSGANLKTTLLNMQEAVLGDYARKADTNSFMKKDSRSASGDLVRLRSARFVKAIESDVGQRLAENLIKTVCGDDGLVCRKLYEDEQEYNVEFKLLLATNNKPRIDGTELGIWRKVKLIPFTFTMPDKERVKDYHKILIAEELSGVLNWMLEGCMLWQKEGLKDCTEVSDATAEYKTENDSVAKFLNAMTVRETGLKISARMTYTAYKQYCDEMGEYEKPVKEFKLEMENKNYKWRRESAGMMWLDLKLM